MENALWALLAGYLDQAKRHIEGLTGVGDVGDAIHDFRLSMRRLRSWFKICREYEVAKFSGKNRKRLKTLVRATNESRDLDVHAKLLNEYIETLNLSANADAERLVKDWNSQRSHSHNSTIQDAQRTFREVEPRLRALISAIKEHEEAQDLNLVSFVARVMRSFAKRLDEQLDAVKSAEDTDAIHRARLLAKVLRYLGEPLAKSDPAFAALVRELHALQDVIGGLRDAQMFAQRLAQEPKSSALSAIHDLNQSQILQFFSIFQAAHLKPQGSRFENKVKLLFARILDQP